MPPNDFPDASTITQMQVMAFGEELAKRFAKYKPEDSGYPMSVLLMASSRDDDSSAVQWFTTCVAVAPDMPDGRLQAFVLARDMLLMLHRMDTDWKLGMSLLPAIMAQNPLLVEKFGARAPQVEQNADGTRTVRDIVDDGGKAFGGAGNVH